MTNEELIARIISPHKKISREVTEPDIPRVLEEVEVLHGICFLPLGKYSGALAMAHSQIDDKDPLTFFVTKDRGIIINPVITRRVRHTSNSTEGCMSYIDKPMITVQRAHKIEVEYQTLDKDYKLSGIMKGIKKGKDAFIWQHEIDHGLSSYIYDKEIDK